MIRQFLVKTDLIYIKIFRSTCKCVYQKPSSNIFGEIAFYKFLLLKIANIVS